MPRPSSPLGAKASTERSYRAHFTTNAARRTKPHDDSISERTTKNAQLHTLPFNQPFRFTCQTTRQHQQRQSAPIPAISSCSASKRTHPPKGGQHTKPSLETVGIEPTTPCLQSRCSPTELRPLQAVRIHSQPTKARTTDPGRKGMGQGGLEPPTPRLSSVCSNQLSYWPEVQPTKGRTIARTSPAPSSPDTSGYAVGAQTGSTSPGPAA